MLQPRTIEASICKIRHIGGYFAAHIIFLSKQQLTNYVSALQEPHSSSPDKLAQYGLIFFYGHVLHKPWA
ncbi:MAG: recombinase, partial [Gammaproteobacteria bacterium]